MRSKDKNNQSASSAVALAKAGRNSAAANQSGEKWLFVIRVDEDVKSI